MEISSPIGTGHCGPSHSLLPSESVFGSASTVNGGVDVGVDDKVGHGDGVGVSNKSSMSNSGGCSNGKSIEESIESSSWTSFIKSVLSAVSFRFDLRARIRRFRRRSLFASALFFFTSTSNAALTSSEWVTQASCSANERATQVLESAAG